MNSSITRAYHEATVRSADAVQLVIMLHEMLIDDLRGCVIAVRANDIQARTNQAGHAIEVLDQLQRGIDPDRHGEAARNMDRLYSLARLEIWRAQVNADALVFEQQMKTFISLREAWQQAQEQRGRPQTPHHVLDSMSNDPAQERKWTV